LNHSTNAQPVLTSQESIDSIYEWVDDKITKDQAIYKNGEEKNKSLLNGKI